MIGLINLEVYNSIFNVTDENNNFELYTDNFDGLLFVESKDEHEEIIVFSNIKSENLQDKKLGPCIYTVYKKLETEKRRTDGYYMLLLGYGRSPFRVFESYHRIVVDLDEDNDLEQRLEKKLNDMKSFNNSINNIKELITYFKDKNKKSKKKRGK